MYFSLRPLLKRLSLIGLLAFLVMCFPTISAEAFTPIFHSHTESCYEEVVKQCRDHCLEDRYYIGSGHCLTCDKANFNINIHSKVDVCRNNLIAERSVFWEATCVHCGNRIVYGVSVPDFHEYTERVLNCGFSDSTPIAEVDLSVGTKDWTADPVEMSVCRNKVATGVELSFSWDKGLGSGPSVKVSESGNYSVTVKSNVGAAVVLTATVSNIDRQPPKLELKLNTNDWSELGVVLSAVASDGESGVEAFSFNGGEYGSADSFEIKKNGTYTVSVRDRVGNITTSTIEITNVGRDPKVVAAEEAAYRQALARQEAARLEEQRLAAEQAEAERAREEAELKKKQQEAAKAKAEKEKAKAEKAKALADKEKAEAELKKAEAEKEKAEAEKEKAEAELKKAELEAEPTEDREDLAEQEKVVEVQTGDGGSAEESSAEPRPQGELIPVVIEEEAVAAVAVAAETVVAEPVWEKNTPESRPKSIIWLKGGVVIALAGVLILSMFSYVYVSENGKKRLVARARIVKEGRSIIAHVPEGRLKHGERYSLYISPWKYSERKRPGVYIMVENQQSVINVDEGKTFVY